jgi:hypothetical protein
MQITNVKVSFERMVRPADFESARAAVELSAVVDEGEDAAAVSAELLGLAKKQALAAVGKGPRVPLAERIAAETAAHEKEHAAEEKAELTPGQKAAATRKANAEAKKAAEAAAAETPAEVPAALADPVKPAEEAELPVAPQPAPLDAGISDSDFQVAIGEIAASMVQGGQKIKALMKKEEITKLRDVAPGDREAFLEKARGLK